jgi:cytochrome c oxidase cbb3-type subunit 4
MKEGLQYFTDIHLTILGLIIFFVWFVAMAIWIYVKTPENHVQYMSDMPLKDEEVL